MKTGRKIPKRVFAIAAFSLALCAGLVLFFFIQTNPGALRETNVGLQSVGGEQFYFNAEGVRQYGWQTIDGKQYYFDPVSGAAINGWFTDTDGAVYYFGEEGWALTGEVEIDGKTYTFGADGKLEEEENTGYSWQTEDGGYYCIGPDGQRVTGLMEIGGSLYFFNGDGLRQEGLQSLSGGWYYFHPGTGRAARGWTTIDENTYYFGEDGRAYTGDATIAGVAYQFDAEGKLIVRRNVAGGGTASSSSALLNPQPATPPAQGTPVVSYSIVGEGTQRQIVSSAGEVAKGLQSLAGKLYYCDPETGYIQTGKKTIGGEVYVFDAADGHALSGWVQDPGNAQVTYYLGDAGPALKNLQLLNGRRYYFDPTTAARLSGLQVVDGKLYLFAGEGDNHALTGWQEVPETAVQQRSLISSANTNTTTRKYYFCEEHYALVGLHKLADGLLYGFGTDGAQLRGWREIDGRYYLFDGVNGSAITNNWGSNAAGGTVYLGPEGTPETGLVEVGGEWYYLGSDFVRAGGWRTVDGKTYCFDGVDNAALKNQWATKDGVQHYLGSNGAAVTGLQTVGDYLHLFAADGALQYGPQEVGGKRYFFDTENGRARYGWIDADGGVCYVGAEGYAVTGLQTVVAEPAGIYYFEPATALRSGGWKTLNGKRYLFAGPQQQALIGPYSEGAAHYLFGTDGAALTGVQTLDGARYYYDANGVRQTGWREQDGYRYYFDTDTAKGVSGWLTDVATTGIYYLDPQTGRAATATREIDGVSYTFDEKGRLKPGAESTGSWVDNGGNIYYVENSGNYVTGLQYIDGALYRFDDNGVRKNSWYTAPDGKVYYFDTENGDKAHSGWMEGPGGKTFYFGLQGYAYTGIQPITSGENTHLYAFNLKGEQLLGLVVENGARYYFDEESGRAVSGWHPSAGAEEARYYDKDTHIAATGMVNIPGDGLYLFDDAGVRQTGWHTDDAGRHYYFGGAGGKAVIGSYTSGQDTYFFTEGGYALVGLHKLDADGKWHYFAQNGVQHTGWLRTESGKRYYFGAGGGALTGEHALDDGTYFFHEEEAFALTGTHEMGGRTWIFDADGRLLSKEATTGYEWKTIDDKLYYINSAGEHFTGITKVEPYWYRFDANGAVVPGWYTDDDGNNYFFAANGRAHEGWYIDGTDAYYFGPEGAALTGQQTINGTAFTFNDEGKLVEGQVPVYDEWVPMGEGGWCYYDATGKPATGLRQIGGSWYFFNKDGLRLSGWQTAPEGGRYYFGGENGEAWRGWRQVGDVWYRFDDDSAVQLCGLQHRTDDEGNAYTHYFYTDGTAALGWKDISGARRYFHANGAMAIGWETIDGEEYYFFENGERAAGVVSIEGKLHSFDADGKRLYGWNKDKDGNRYYFGENGAATGWELIEGRYYCFDETTARQLTGWQDREVDENTTHRFYYYADGSLPAAGVQTVSGVQRYFFTDGHMAQGWQTLEGALYHFAVNGEMAKGPTTVEGVEYPFGQDGVLTPGWYTAADGARYYFTQNGAAKGWVLLPGEGEVPSEVWYRFDEVSAIQQTGRQTRQEGDVTYTHYFAANGSAQVGWATTTGGKQYYLANGTMATGWTDIDEAWYYFMPKTGTMATGAVVIDEVLYSFDSNGQLITGWNTDADGKRYYFTEDGPLKGWSLVPDDGRWYRFDETTGAQQTGWWTHVVDGVAYNYYFFADGSLPEAGWNSEIGSETHYVTTEGHMARGWLILDTGRYNFTPFGVARTGWAMADGVWYHFDDAGKQLTGWQERTLESGYVALYYYFADGTMPGEGWTSEIENTRRYVTGDGELALGWLTVGSYRYYFETGGIPATGTRTIDEKTYTFDAEGRYVSPPVITGIDYETGSAAKKKVTINAQANALLESAALEYSFDGGKTWQSANNLTFDSGTTIPANTLKVRDALGNQASYGEAIHLVTQNYRGHGIDVSSYQGTINWAQVAASGQVDFAIIRGLTWSNSAYSPKTGKYTGYYVIDSMFDYNVREAKRYGIKVGAYLYSYAFNADEMEEEARFFINSSQVQGLFRDGIYFDLPVFIDYEDEWITDNTPNRTATQRTQDLLHGMIILEQASGYRIRPGFYLSRDWATRLVDTKYLQNLGYDFWLAHWGIPAHGWSPSPQIWQYNNGEYFGDTGVPGISGRVDKNWMYVDYTGIINGGNTTAPGNPDPVEYYEITVTDQYGNRKTGAALDILSQIVMAEVGGFSNAEVYKAQAVAAQSWIIYQQATGVAAPSVALKAPTAQVTAAVQQVLGERLLYNGAPALTPYYAYSNGTTNDARYWNASNNLPYLTSVSIPYDAAIKPAIEVSISATDLRKKLIEIYEYDVTAGIDPQNWIKITSRNSAGYITGLNVCSRTPSTEYFITRIVPSIGSPDFDVSYNGSSFVFRFRGNGHCIGMSQVGASGLAQQGFTYKQILAHFYPGTSISMIY